VIDLSDLEVMTLDWETYYAQDYTLSKMTTEEYVRDPRFEPILVSVKYGSAPAFWILPERFAYLCDEIDWDKVALVAHHAHFDGLILSHHFGVSPGFWIDTLSMARYVDGPDAGNSLREICIRKGIGYKGDYVTYAKGKRLADFTRDELKQYGDYSCVDSDRTYDAAMVYLQEMPADELRIIDHNTRMFTEPVFRGNTALLTQAYTGEIERKKKLLLRVSEPCIACGGTGQQPDMISGPKVCKECQGLTVSKKPFSSAAKFSDLLRNYGVEPPMKPNKAGTVMIPAFAKTDPGMQELLEDPEEEIRFLAEARLAVKSTLVESRAQRYLQCAQRGPMPVYLKYGGAHTRRRSGGDKSNWQNMGRGDKKRPEMILLKQSIEAPEGQLIVAADSAQIQARLTAWLCGQWDLVKAFAEKRDVYSEFASQIYMRPVDRKKNKDDFIPGFVGKTCILGLGFQMWWPKFAFEMLKGALGGPPVQFTIKDAQTMGINAERFLNRPANLEKVSQIITRLSYEDMVVHCMVCAEIVKKWRGANPAIEKGWELMEYVINAMITGEPMTFGPGDILRTEKERIIHVPSGAYLNYRGIQRDGGQASYWTGRSRAYIYGGSLLENVIQWLETIVMNEDLIEILDVGVPIKLQTHDELVGIVPVDAAKLTLDFMVERMEQSPWWAPQLPLSAEGGMGRTYADAKPK
jgi:hypothetical protein